MAGLLTKIAIYGAGGFGREVAWLIDSVNKHKLEYEIVSFIDDDINLHGKVFNNIHVLDFSTLRAAYGHAWVVAAIGHPRIRERVIDKTSAFGFKFPTLIHPRTEHSQWVEIGEGTVICAGSILTTNICIGKHVQLNLDCTIGHDVIMGDYTTLSPGVHVSGYVHFGKRVYVGTGAVILNGTEANPIEIGDDVVIGAGAVVTKSIISGITAVGIPAKPISKQPRKDPH